MRGGHTRSASALQPVVTGRRNSASDPEVGMSIFEAVKKQTGLKLEVHNVCCQRIVPAKSPFFKCGGERCLKNVTFDVRTQQDNSGGCESDHGSANDILRSHATTSILFFRITDALSEFQKLNSPPTNEEKHEQNDQHHTEASPCAPLMITVISATSSEYKQQDNQQYEHFRFTSG